MARKTTAIYLEWAKCSTPFRGMAAMESLVTLVVPTSPDGVSAEDCLWEYETHGRKVSCCEPQLLSTLRRGKANRDWWTKEIGWWTRHCGSLYLPEEFLPHLTPEAFFQLFKRYPITAVVRSLMDNYYSDTQYQDDMRLRELGLDRERDGVRVIREVA